MGSHEFSIREAIASDAQQVQAAIQLLLRELSGNSARVLHNFDVTFAELLNSPHVGGCIVAEREGHIIGVLTYSHQIALRTGGSYVIIQEFWVAAAARGARIGEQLIEHLATANTGSAIEVGLPPESFGSVQRTRNFYNRVGFELIGDRLRYAT